MITSRVSMISMPANMLIDASSPTVTAAKIQLLAVRLPRGLPANGGSPTRPQARPDW